MPIGERIRHGVETAQVMLTPVESLSALVFDKPTGDIPSHWSLSLGDDRKILIFLAHYLSRGFRPDRENGRMDSRQTAKVERDLGRLMIAVYLVNPGPIKIF